MTVVAIPPSPAADGIVVRVTAARAASVADELRRVSAAVAGSVEQVRWSGSARIGWSSSVATRRGSIDVAAERFNGYAAALQQYALVVDELAPQLTALRARILACAADYPSPTGVPDANAGTRISEQAHRTAEYNRLWNEWDLARRRCIAALADAGRLGADPSGWSRFMHAVSGAVHHGVSLRELSRVLGDLTEGLVVAGLVLSVVFPPAAAAVWAAVAVVSVAQLAVDGLRRARGEHGVGASTLAWDAVGALPVGRLFKEGMTAAEASRAIESVPEELRSTPMVPGGGLGAHEAAGGHTLERHVGLKTEQLKSRFAGSLQPTAASTFTDRAVAERAISRLLSAENVTVQRWLANSKAASLALSGEAPASIGRTLYRGADRPQEARFLTVVLRKDPMMSTGYRIHTCFPKP